MAGELCAVLLQAFYLTLDSPTVFGVFLIMQYFIYFTCNPIASSLCNIKHPPYINFSIKNNENKHLYTQYLHSFVQYLHIWWLLLLVYLLILDLDSMYSRRHGSHNFTDRLF